MVKALPFIHQPDRVARKACEVSATDWQYQTHVKKYRFFFHVCCYGFSQGWKSWYNTVVCMIKYFPIFVSPKLAKISRFPNLGDGRIKLVFFDQNFTDCFIRQSQTHLALKSRGKITKDLARISTTQERNFFFRADLSAFWSTLALLVLALILVMEG